MIVTSDTTRLLSKRIADAIFQREAPLFSQTVRAQLLRAFGARGMPFFNLYTQIYQFTHGGESPEDGFVERFRDFYRIVYSMMSTDAGKNQANDLVTYLRPLLARLDDPLTSPSIVRKIAEIYGQLVQVVAAERDVFLSGRAFGSMQWILFRIMSEKEQRLERVKKNNPALYDTIQRSKTVMKTLDRNIEHTILDFALEPSRKEIFGKPVNIGTDPATGEQHVFDEDGDVLPVTAYIEKRKKLLRMKEKQDRIFPDNINDLRKAPDDVIDMAADLPVTYMALTDDRAKQKVLTRIYPVKDIAGEQVVVDGRFKGFYVADLVNSSGRMLEGVAYDFDPKLGRPVPIETKNPDGSVNVRNLSREPYVTVDQGRLFLKIPSGHAYTAHRNAISKLLEMVPAIEYVEGSRKSTYRFGPTEFAVIREALGGLSLSTAAMNLIRNYFTKLAKDELATSSTNLQHYTADALGGFKPDVRLLVKQKKALAWMDSRGMSGVCAMGTGTGKTMTVIAAMQKLNRDVVMGQGINGRYLYVCPAALKGNFPKECHVFLQDPKALIEQTDVMSYAQFVAATKRDPDFGKDYIAVFFDEAQEIKNPKSKTAQAAMALPHSRKILLTASPMERCPMEVYSLACIANNEDINTLDGRVRMKAFRKRFAEEVGGRIIGMKNDPVTARDLRIWVKRNLFYADKQDVEEFALPGLRRTSMVVTMPAEIESQYRAITQGIADVLRGMVAKYRDRSPDASDPAIEAARIRLAKQFNLLTRLANNPDGIVPGAGNPKMREIVRALDDRIPYGARALLFTDSPDMAETASQYLTQRFPGKTHAACYSDRIELWKSGEITQTFRKKSYQDADGQTWPEAEWQIYVMSKVVNPNPDITSATLTSAYSVGQNLQRFNVVIHLDRDTWNSEEINQRTSRAWRQGQRDAVEEIFIDMVYENPIDDQDRTLDQIRAYMQQLESELFDRVIVESQTEALGKEYFGMSRLDSSFFAINRRMMELTLSPYLKKVAEGT